MTVDRPIAVVEHRGYRLSGMYGRAPARDAADIVRMWIDAGVLLPAEAQRRVSEVVVVARAPGDRGAWYFYRTYVRPEHRGVAGVPTRMVALALQELRVHPHPQAPRGVVIITENAKLMRRGAMSRLEGLGFHLLGSDARGLDVWCHRFDGAIPVAPPGIRRPDRR